MEEKLRRVEESQIRMEDELVAKVKAIFDAREVQLDVNDRILETLSRIESKLDRYNHLNCIN
jgi:LEA14-like dessication related protein